MPNSDNESSGWSWTSWMVNRREVIVSLAALIIVVLTLLLGRVNSTVVLITSANDSLPFPDIEASFAGKVPGTGIIGWLFAANPLNACVSLQAYGTNETDLPAFLLIERGDCDFVTKVQYAQDAGYAAAIVYNNEDDTDLVTMTGNGFGIEIPAVFVSQEAGRMLLQYAGDLNSRLYMLPALENTAWSVMAVSFISLLAVSAILSAFFFVRRQRLRRNNMLRLNQESPSLSKAELKALPVSVFNRDENASPEICAICLEEYVNGDKLRVLPCNHEFHIACIDQWLTTRRSFCPICKRDAHNKGSQQIPSESTPLLGSVSRRAGSTTDTSSGSSGTSVHGSAQAMPDDIC